MNNDAPCMIQINNGVAGFFKMEKKKVGNDTLIEVAPWQENLILDRGLNDLGSRSAFQDIAYACAVGSGSTPPQTTDTGLVAKVAQADRTTTGGSTTGSVTSPVPYGWVRFTYEFPAGTATGNLSEVGVKWQGNDNLMNTRALIKDSSGRPTTITVLADEILVVTYEIRLYPDMTDKTYTDTIKGVSTTVTVRPGRIKDNWFSGTSQMTPSNYLYGGAWYYGGTGLGVGPVDGEPTGTSVTNSTQRNDEGYVANSYQRIQRMNLVIGDFPNRTITGFLTYSGIYGTQIGFSPGWLKTNAETVSLRISLSWSRYTP